MAARRSTASAAKGKGAAALTVRPGVVRQEQPPPALLPGPADIELPLPDVDPPALASEVPCHYRSSPPPDVAVPLPELLAPAVAPLELELASPPFRTTSSTAPPSG